MKKIIALIILTVIFNSSFAKNEEVNIDIVSTKNKINKINDIDLEKTNDDADAEYFDTLRKTDSDSKNILGIGQNKQNSFSTDTEICSIATDKSDGTGLCGVPADNRSVSENATIGKNIKN